MTDKDLPQLIGMATVDPNDVAASCIALDMFVNTDTSIIHGMMRSMMGFCDCPGKYCADGRVARVELVANNHPVRETPVTPEEIEDIKIRVTNIINWFDGILESADGQNGLTEP